ncbi:7TM diverse intracellular signaling domain-containing protein [Mucilaginibacter sp. BT774]|uniref:sensor histidine kinase n=1 Tax=Mucilaginibacter sp. BT774 TaxID=3062276 RepID=UPI00267445C7|nr:7TM diverse intracellular signaling domain-containing protein [Mucilaginibacter sp. BT774]MDO3628933.1 7TM diverse intracellular signaling domain-containing protein [Mucilaginibacter sp. BT774]
MRKIFLIIYLIVQNTLLFAAQVDTLTIHEKETKLLTHNYFFELEDTASRYKINDVISNPNFHPISSSLPILNYSKPTTWLKFILKNKTTRAFVPINIGPGVIDNFDIYYTDPEKSKHIISLTSDIPSRDSKLIKQNNTFINCIIFPDSIRTIYLRVKSSSPGVIPIQISSANEYFRSADFNNIVAGGFMGIVLIMAFYNLMLYTIVRDLSYLYYVFYIIFLGLSQLFLRGYGITFFLTKKAILNNYFIPFTRIFFGYSVLLFTSEFLQLKQTLKSYFKFYYLLYALYTAAFIAIITGFVLFAYNIITYSSVITAVCLLFIGGILYFRGFKPAKYFMIGWGIFLVSVLIAVARSRGFIKHNDFTANIVLYSASVELMLFSIALADKIRFYRKQTIEMQQLSLTIARENERLITEQNILLESEVNARTNQLIKTNQNLSATIEDLQSTHTKLLETEKMASLGQLTAGIAHEINNPINFVSSNVKPLRLDFLEIFSLLDKYKEAGEKPDKKELLDLANQYKENIDVDFLKSEIMSLLDGIETGAHRTTEIIQSLRTFSRTDEKILKLTDINKSVLSTLILLRSSIPYNIEIKPVLSKLPLLNCYPSKINQIMMNLINNGIQAIKAKESQNNECISITTFDSTENIIIQITDTGIGMNKEVKQKIFDPFFTTKEVGEGTGLGLSIVFGIIEDHRGKIEVQSEPGEGSTFTIILPKDLE